MEIIIITFILIAVVVALNMFKKPNPKNPSDASNFSDEFDVRMNNNVDLFDDNYERDEFISDFDSSDFDGGDDD